jgi:thiamine pyrophosphokinase
VRAVVVANGEMGDTNLVLEEIGPDDLIVCADGGTLNALALGLRPQVVVGDVDSISSDLRHDLEAQGTRFIVHSPHKDETDTELALKYCVEQAVSGILFLGALGGRLDHMLANLLLLADPAWRSVPILVMDGPVSVHLCSVRCEIFGQAGDVVSLLPWGGDAKGIRTDGLEYPLHGETLFLGSARGVSNVMLGGRAVVMVDKGLLLVIHMRAG